MGVAAAISLRAAGPNAGIARCVAALRLSLAFAGAVIASPGSAADSPPPPASGPVAAAPAGAEDTIRAAEVARLPPGGGSSTQSKGTRIEVRPGLDYLRVRDLHADLPLVDGALEAPRLIVDLRFVRGGLNDAIEFGRILARTSLPVPVESTPQAPRAVELLPKARATPRPATQLTLILVNHQTSGPLEAVLDALQRANEIILVGTPTAGDAAVFVEGQPTPGRQAAAAALERSPGSAAVAPRFPVELPESDDATAYGAFESGTELALLLDPPVEKPRFDEARLLRQFEQSARRAPAPNGTGATVAPARMSAAPVRPPFDRVLHRAVNTIIALEALGRLPPVPGNGS